MNTKTKVVLFDLWRTLARSHCAEPVWDLQKAIGCGLAVNGGQELFRPDDNFLKFCLTTNIKCPDRFMDEAVHRFGGVATDQARDIFREILLKESGNTSMYLDVPETLEALAQRGYRLGVISNLWSFPAEYIFDRNGLGRFFPEFARIYSFEVGYRKPEPEIYQEACRRLNARPEECLMVGDNLQADIIGALNAGMKAALINREMLVAKEDVPQGVPNMSRLPEVIEYLDREGNAEHHPLTLAPHPRDSGTGTTV